MLWDQSHVDSRVRRFLDTEVAEVNRRLAEIAARIGADEARRDEQTLAELGKVLQQSVDVCAAFELSVADEAEVILQGQTLFRRATAELLQQSWIVQRAQEKPTGFPGDCQMLDRIYNLDTGTTGFGGYLDTILLQLPLGRGVRERIAVAQQFLIDEVARRQGDVRILDIASGPCREFVGWTQQPRNGEVSLTCLDSDPLALEFVEQNVRPTATGFAAMDLQRYNAVRTKSATGNRKRFGQPHILYSVGLADYLPDDLLLDMLAGWRDTVHEDGVVYVAFKDGDAYDKTPYQWHLDWHFLQRTEDDCRRLLQASGFAPERTLMVRDPSGIILHFFCYMQEVPQLRLDAGNALVAPVTSRTIKPIATV